MTPNRLARTKIYLEECISHFIQLAARCSHWKKNENITH